MLFIGSFVASQNASGSLCLGRAGRLASRVASSGEEGSEKLASLGGNCTEKLTLLERGHELFRQLLVKREAHETAHGKMSTAARVTWLQIFSAFRGKGGRNCDLHQPLLQPEGPPAVRRGTSSPRPRTSWVRANAISIIRARSSKTPWMHWIVGGGRARCRDAQVMVLPGPGIHGTHLEASYTTKPVGKGPGLTVWFME